MLKHRWIDRIVAVVMFCAVGITLLFMHGESWGIIPAHTTPGYVSRLFDQRRVHTIDLQLDDWAGFIQAAPNEEYTSCTAVIDGEAFHHIGLRAKGNNSLRLTEDYELCRYNLKLEFDHFDAGSLYYGLDKLSLDASFQDNSYMKTFLALDMMRFMEVPTPLCSYVWVTVNGTPWGLFLAVEEPEEAFAQRCFGNNYGQLYKPDYRSLTDDNADVDLRYTGEDPHLYENIFRNAKFSCTAADQQRLIGALRTLASGERLETAINADEVLRYFAVQVFTLNLDSYIGPTGHNYFLYEQDGILSMLPWDYNLAFGTYCLEMTNPIRDPNVLINYPINTPWQGDVILDRPMFHTLMKQDGYFAAYHHYMDQLLTKYMESGRMELTLRQTMQQIAPYVQQDPTAYCSYEDTKRAVETLIAVCQLRGESIRGQLAGKYPATLRAQAEHPNVGVDASQLQLQDLGALDDLSNAKIRQDAALSAIR